MQHGINIEETADPQPVTRGQSYLNLTAAAEISDRPVKPLWRMVGPVSYAADAA